MGVNVRPAAREALRQLGNRWSGHPAASAVGQCLAAAAGGFILAGAAAGPVLLPLPLALSMALGLGLRSFGAYAGGCLGYVLLWGWDRGMEPMAAGLLAEACLCIFGDQLSRENRWFAPGCAAVFTLLVGFLFLLEQRFAPAAVWQLALRAGVASGGCVLFRRGLLEEGLTRLLLPAALVSGLCAWEAGGFSPGLAAGCMLSAAALPTPAALPAAVLCGLALELHPRGCGGAAAVLLLAALLARDRKRWLTAMGCWLLAVLAGVLLTGAGPQLLAAAILGGALARLLPAGRLFGWERTAGRGDARLTAAAGLFAQLAKTLEAAVPPRTDPETAAAFDRVADRVCRLCSQFDDCWGRRLGETCAMLDRAAPAMEARGRAVQEDLPEAFWSRCRHSEGFLGAINRELDDRSCRRQSRRRLYESRVVVARQFQTLARALVQPPQRTESAPRFTPELSCRSRGRGGAPLSGDQTASFCQGQWYYVLLCDGMGAGRAARAEAGTAVAVLRQLLQAGATPQEAMESLNGLYLLRDDGAFATVDLLQISLFSGEGTLYKWGAAPSYLKTKGEVRQIGTASPPPGIGAGEAHRPEETRLSLARGEMLVLVSDGAGGEMAERFIRQYGGHAPEDLATGVLRCTEAQGGEDDRTAAVLALRRAVSL